MEGSLISTVRVSSWTGFSTVELTDGDWFDNKQKTAGSLELLMAALN